MAGDSYSCIIENFSSENIGRYSVTAENPSGKATCSAEIGIEGLIVHNYIKFRRPSASTTTISSTHINNDVGTIRFSECY
jgi:hypothetical protein